MTSITTARQQEQVMVKHPIWPMPKHIQIKGQDEYVKLASNFKFIAAYSIDKNNIQVPPILLNGMKRHEALLQNKLKLASSATTTTRRSATVLRSCWGPRPSLSVNRLSAASSAQMSSARARTTTFRRAELAF